MGAEPTGWGTVPGGRGGNRRIREMWGIGAVGKTPLQRKQLRAGRRLKIFTGYSGPRRQVIKFKN